MGEKHKMIQEEFWFDMPEFVQPKQKPYLEIIVRFASKDDLEEFSKIINQKITKKTKSLWHPKLIRGIHGGKRYVEK